MKSQIFLVVLLLSVFIPTASALACPPYFARIYKIEPEIDCVRFEISKVGWSCSVLTMRNNCTEKVRFVGKLPWKVDLSQWPKHELKDGMVLKNWTFIGRVGEQNFTVYGQTIYRKRLIDTQIRNVFSFSLVICAAMLILLVLLKRITKFWLVFGIFLAFIGLWIFIFSGELL